MGFLGHTCLFPTPCSLWRTFVFTSLLIFQFHSNGMVGWWRCKRFWSNRFARFWGCLVGWFFRKALDTWAPNSPFQLLQAERPEVAEALAGMCGVLVVVVVVVNLGCLDPPPKVIHKGWRRAETLDYQPQIQLCPQGSCPLDGQNKDTCMYILIVLNKCNVYP